MPFAYKQQEQIWTNTKSLALRIVLFCQVLINKFHKNNPHIRPYSKISLTLNERRFNSELPLCVSAVFE